ncbi:MAG: putative enzyme involved in inositol metabolism [Verrucomicrobiales bacterium]|nr:putative enzyme involved in inositol metabolism [Verrucomicrobiales bacterium]
MDKPKPAHFLNANANGFRYVEKTNPQISNLQFLTYGVYELTGKIASGALAHPEEEALLFGWHGKVVVTVNGKEYALDRYDTLYIPRGATYRFAQESGESKVIVCRATADNTHPVFHSKWSEFSKDEKRIRHLKGKDVFLMFDVSEGADKLIAGFTLFQPHQRSYPPHNHTDQEEIYIFTKGRGSMEVYADEETKSFVRSVNEGDAVTIPILNYHPVFSQEEELDFIWCIAGNRYWVGDKNKDFMTGKVDKLTT